jgi:hypothetical protein
MPIPVAEPTTVPVMSEPVVETKINDVSSVLQNFVKTKIDPAINARLRKYRDLVLKSKNKSVEIMPGEDKSVEHKIEEVKNINETIQKYNGTSNAMDKSASILQKQRKHKSNERICNIKKTMKHH